MSHHSIDKSVFLRTFIEVAVTQGFCNIWLLVCYTDVWFGDLVN